MIILHDIYLKYLKHANTGVFTISPTCHQVRQVLCLSTTVTELNDYAVPFLLQLACMTESICILNIMQAHTPLID